MHQVRDTIKDKKRHGKALHRPLKAIFVCHLYDRMVEADEHRASSVAAMPLKQGLNPEERTKIS